MNSYAVELCNFWCIIQKHSTWHFRAHRIFQDVLFGHTILGAQHNVHDESVLKLIETNFSWLLTVTGAHLPFLILQESLIFLECKNEIVMMEHDALCLKTDYYPTSPYWMDPSKTWTLFLVWNRQSTLSSVSMKREISVEIGRSSIGSRFKRFKSLPKCLTTIFDTPRFLSRY